MTAPVTTPIDIYQRPAELLQALIRFDTTNPPGNEAACIHYIRDLLNEAGIETQLFARIPERPNLSARLPGTGAAEPLLLYGHVDVVTTENQDWQHPPFAGAMIDGYIWGRGALDMKGGVTMMLCSLLKLKAEGIQLPMDIVLAVVSDEEAGADYGAKFLVEQHPNLFTGIRYALGEFGGFTMYLGDTRFYPIMVTEKQVCSVRAIVRGSAGHGAIRKTGGAMAKLARMLTTLDQKRLPVHITPVAEMMVNAMANAMPAPMDVMVRQLLDTQLTDTILDQLGEKGLRFDAIVHNSVNATIVHGGSKINVIPSEIIVDMDGRLLPGYTPEAMLAELTALLGDEVELQIAKYEPGAEKVDLALYDTLAGILKGIDPEGVPIPYMLTGVTDGRFFSQLGIQTYGFTPMSLPDELNFTTLIHAANERIPVEALEFGTHAMFTALQTLGGKLAR